MSNVNRLATALTTNGEGAAKKNGKLAMTENALTVLRNRYLRKDRDGKLIETPWQLFVRVADNIAEAERKFGGETAYEEYRQRFLQLMTQLYFLPNSPTLMNAGRELQQLSACFVLPVEDSITSIFSAIKHTALIHKSGGGTGFSFSRLRPSNDLVSTSHGLSSGPISFMKVFNEATDAINQGGFRRGANMGILRVDHPDILAFIQMKDKDGAMSNFNISVALTDDFMKTLKADGTYPLVNPRSGKVVKTVRAREVFHEIVRQAWKNGEPGIVFLDAINRDNPTPQVGAIESTNPCGEQPLLPYEACNLGSINLARMAADGAVDWDKLKTVTRDCTRFLDDVCEMSRFPLPEIEAMVRSNRKIGLGVMGFADLLFKLDIPYDSEEAVSLAEQVMKRVSEESHRASEDLARERGAFPNFSGSRLEKLGVAPRRNATCTTIAPTGTLSILAGTSSGVEPLFAISYVRTVMDKTQMVEVHPYFLELAHQRGFYSEALMKRVAEAGTIAEIEEIPEEIRRVFRVAHDISPVWHIRLQAAFQKYTDNAVSKTVNFPHSAKPEEIEKVYQLAFESGCKGVTVYRDGSREEQVLATRKSKAGTEAAPAPFKPKARPEVLHGTTWKMKSGCGNLYVTINEDGEGRPFELFTQMGKAGGCTASQSEAISRMISFALRSGADIKEIARQLCDISCHVTVLGKEGKILSCADAIAKAIYKHINEKERRAGNRGIKPLIFKPELKRGACPECGGNIEHESGCVVCRSCGYSEC